MTIDPTNTVAWSQHPVNSVCETRFTDSPTSPTSKSCSKVVVPAFTYAGDDKFALLTLLVPGSVLTCVEQNNQTFGLARLVDAKSQNR